MKLTMNRKRNIKKYLTELEHAMKEGTIGKILTVVVGNIALLFSKMLTWLVVPKLLGVIEYGYYKTFTLYLVYAMLLHFGFPDGILLLYGGKEYQKINQYEFRLYSKFFSAFQVIISIIIIGTAMTLYSGIEQYIFCMIGVDSLLVNMATYYKFISQAVMQFKKFALRNVIQSALQVLVLCFIVIFAKIGIVTPNGRVYIFCIVLIDAVLLVWYVGTYKDITFGQADKFRSRFNEIKKIFKVGILLTISFQISHLVFVLDSQMVEILFDVKTFSLYAFAYSVTNMIIAVIGAIATVMFPSLKRLEIRDAVSRFPMLMAAISVIVFLMLTAYFPLTLFIKWFLRDYVPALEYLQIIMPGLAVSCCINMIIFTYYKVMNWLKRYLYIALVMLLFSGILNWCSYMAFHKPAAFSAASIITLLIWYLWSESYLVRQFKTKWIKNFVYIIVEMSVFYVVIASINNWWQALFIYFVIYMGTTILIYKNEMQCWKR